MLLSIYRETEFTMHDREPANVARAMLAPRNICLVRRTQHVQYTSPCNKVGHIM